MNETRRALAPRVSILLALLLALPVALPASDLVILYTNDTHGRIEMELDEEEPRM